MAGELGITGPQRLVLRVVGQVPEISAGELAHVLRLHPSTITGILQRLGLIARKRDPGDSRRVRLRIKPAALAFTRVSPGTTEKAVALALDDAGLANVRAARKVLTAVAARLSQM